MASVIPSTTPKTNRANDPHASGAADAAADVTVLSAGEEDDSDRLSRSIVPNTGSISRRMMVIAAGWISILLLVGGIALDRALTNLVSDQFDEQLETSLNAMAGSAEIDPFGEIYFNRMLGDQRYLEPNSGRYWQITGGDFAPYLSRSLWDEPIETKKDVRAENPIYYDGMTATGEKVRMAHRTLGIPGSDLEWQFVVAGARGELDAQIRNIRSILLVSFLALGIGLFLMAMVQTWYGLGPLRRIRRAIARIRTAGSNRVTDPLPLEVRPMVDELNALLEHSEKQAEEARTHAGNLAHALKTPLTVLTNAAHAKAGDLDDTVMREAAVMRRQVDHHLARARAVGRRAVGLARTNVFISTEAVSRAVSRLYPDARFDTSGSQEAIVSLEKQDLEEMLGNLIENAAKYGGGSVFVTIDTDPDGELCTIWIEDDGEGIAEADRAELFERGARLDTEKPGTGLGLAIVRDVAEIYGGGVELAESEDLGGLLVKLSLPRA